MDKVAKAALLEQIRERSRFPFKAARVRESQLYGLDPFLILKGKGGRHVEAWVDFRDYFIVMSSVADWKPGPRAEACDPWSQGPEALAEVMDEIAETLGFQPRIIQEKGTT